MLYVYPFDRNRCAMYPMMRIMMVMAMIQLHLVITVVN